MNELSTFEEFKTLQRFSHTVQEVSTTEVDTEAGKFAATEFKLKYWFEKQYERYQSYVPNGAQIPSGLYPIVYFNAFMNMYPIPPSCGTNSKRHMIYGMLLWSMH
jgi:hypothetical protein